MSPRMRSQSIDDEVCEIEGKQIGRDDRKNCQRCGASAVIKHVAISTDGSGTIISIVTCADSACIKNAEQDIRNVQQLGRRLRIRPNKSARIDLNKAAREKQMGLLERLALAQKRRR